MIDKLQLRRWDSALDSWGQSLDPAQLLWAVRLVVLALALLACIYGLIGFLQVLGSGAGDGEQLAASEGAGAALNPAAGLDAAAVKAWGWDSDPQAAGATMAAINQPQQDNVKKTNLQMRLEGIVKSDDDKESVAIIAINQESKQYNTGAKLPIAAGVFLREIDVDRIILDNNGSLEELLLFGKDMVQQRKNAVEPTDEPTGVIDKSGNSGVTEMMGRYRQQIQQNPGSINQLIRFSAHTEGGKLAGFKIGAAGNRQDFERLGLEDGDVVTHVNGVELSDYRKALNLYKEVGDLSEIRVQIMRQGQPAELIFNLPSG